MRLSTEGVCVANSCMVTLDLARTGIDNERLNASGDGRNKGTIILQKGKGAASPTKPKK